MDLKQTRSNQRYPLTPRSPQRLIAGGDADWFAVTDLGTWAAVPQLRAYLRSHYRLSAQGTGWLVYDLRR